MHLLLHLLGLDNANGPIYLFWSGIGGYLLVGLGGIHAYLRVKRLHQRHIDSLHHHIDQQFANLTDKSIQ